jgi:hypothetical protein
MKPRIRSVNEEIATALHKVIGDHLIRSGLGHIWKDERTWRTMADEFILACGGKVALVDRETYGRIFANSEQFKLIRKYVEDYQAMLPPDRKKEQARRQNPYAKWAAENMNGEKKE